jgi:DNA-directed RNA polymerase
MFEYLNSEKENVFNLIKYVPMIYPPAPWKDTRVGAYYFNSTKVIRSELKEQENVIRSKDMRYVYSGRALLRFTYS